MIPEDINLEELEVRPYEEADVLMGRDNNLDPILVVKPADPGDLLERVVVLEDKVDEIEPEVEALKASVETLESQVTGLGLEVADKAEQADLIALGNTVTSNTADITHIETTLIPIIEADIENNKEAISTLQEADRATGQRITTLDVQNVKLTGAQAIQGEKTFETGVTLDHGADLKLMYDDEDPSNPTFILGETPNGTQYNVAGLRSYSNGQGGFFNQTEYGSTAIQWNGNTLSFPTFDHPAGLDWTAEVPTDIADTKSVVVLHRQLQHAISNVQQQVQQQHHVIPFGTASQLKAGTGNISNEYLITLMKAITDRVPIVMGFNTNSEGAGSGDNIMVDFATWSQTVITIVWTENIYKYASVITLSNISDPGAISSVTSCTIREPLNINYATGTYSSTCTRAVDFTGNVTFKGLTPVTLPDGGDGSKYLSDDGEWKEVVTLDTAQTITGSKTIAAPITFSGQVSTNITNITTLNVGTKRSTTDGLPGTRLTSSGNQYMTSLSNPTIYFQANEGTGTSVYLSGRSDGLRLSPSLSINAVPDSSYALLVNGATNLSGSVLIGGLSPALLPSTSTGNKFLADDGTWQELNTGLKGALPYTTPTPTSLSFTFEGITATVTRTSTTVVTVDMLSPTNVTLYISKKRFGQNSNNNIRATAYDLVANTSQQVESLTVGTYEAARYSVHTDNHSYSIEVEATADLAICWIDISKHY